MSELFDVLGGETVLFGAVYMELQLLAKEIECMAASKELPTDAPATECDMKMSKAVPPSL